MFAGIEILQKTSLAYSAFCKPLCAEVGLPQTALDILLFFANNPCYKTARDVVEVRHIKANLVSVNVNRLVDEGYLVRLPVQGDRRKTELACTEKAQTVIARGRQKQTEFLAAMFENMDEKTREAFFAALGRIENNLDKMMKENG